MATIQVKDLPEDVAETYKRRAAEAGQSLQAYMRQELIKGARRLSKAEAIRMIEENLESRPGPGPSMDTIVDVIREARGE